jgi:hypothetical protein
MHTDYKPLISRSFLTTINWILLVHMSRSLPSSFCFTNSSSLNCVKSHLPFTPNQDEKVTYPQVLGPNQDEKVPYPQVLSRRGETVTQVSPMLAGAANEARVSSAQPASG